MNCLNFNVDQQQPVEHKILIIALKWWNEDLKQSLKLPIQTQTLFYKHKIPSQLDQS